MRKKRESSFSTLIDTIKEYINLKIEHSLLTATERFSILIGKLAYMTLLACLGTAVLLLLIVLTYNLLMSWIGIPWLVTLILIGFVLLIIGIIAIFRNQLIINPVASSIIRSILDADDDKEEGEEEDDDE